jgi:hypothetical protein
MDQRTIIKSFGLALKGQCKYRKLRGYSTGQNENNELEKCDSFKVPYCSARVNSGNWYQSKGISQ